LPTSWKKPSRVRADTTPFRSAAAAACLALALEAGCRAAPRPAPAGAPRRVVTLAPNLTEIVFALGAGDSLVGVSEYSDFPEPARAVPRIGGLEVSAERVASLHPDLVLASKDGNARGPVLALEAAGIPVLAVSGGSLDEVLEGIRQVAVRLSRGREGELLVAELARRRLAVRALAAGRPRPRALLLVWPDPPQAAGRGTFLDDVLTEAGAANVLGQSTGWPTVSAEFLATAPIDVLVVPQSDATQPAYDQAFRSGPLSRGAIVKARVVRLPESPLTRPGPRVFDVLEQLQTALAASR
jgi:iron complex transport system substrate-binding protein